MGTGSSGDGRKPGMQISASDSRWQRRFCSTGTLFRRRCEERGWSMVPQKARRRILKWIATELLPSFDQQRSRSLCVTWLSLDGFVCQLCSLSQSAPQGQRCFSFFSSPSFLHSKCCSSFSFSSFFRRSPLSPPFVSPAFDSVGHSTSLSRAIGQQLSPSLLRSYRLPRQLYQSQSPFQTHSGTRRRVQESPSPFCPIRQGQPL